MMRMKKKWDWSRLRSTNHEFELEQFPTKSNHMIGFFPSPCLFVRHGVKKEYHAYIDNGLSLH